MDGKGVLPLEIERKFLIEMPDVSRLLSLPDAAVFEISQTYLVSKPGEETRVRCRLSRGGEAEYFKTTKRTLSGAKRVEIEEEITQEAYEQLLAKADPARRTIHKTRYCVPSGAHTLEIDVYPFWQDRAILEIELAAEEDTFCLPGEIRVIREVTDDPRYKNAALASAADPAAL